MNRHLNIFNFFNGSNLDYLEDNLSRGFALCLKYDCVFLDKVLKSVLPEPKYSELFNTDYPDYKIEIDLQNRTSEMEGFSDIIAVACSGMEVFEFDTVAARETDSPETDVSIVINGTCILFEFKRTSEDCAAQLKCQAEKIKGNCSETVKIEYKDLSWSKIVRMLLNVSSLQKQIQNENPFTADFIKFLENFPHWFPGRRLSNIPFPVNESDPNYYYLNSRLNQIKNQIYGEENTAEYSGRFNRYVIKVDFKWINEIGVEQIQKDGSNFIAIRMHIGDTKEQGRHFFGKKPNGFVRQEKVCGYQVAIEPYIRFSHFNSALLWIRPTNLESRKTHNLEFFKNFAGKHQRSNWRRIEEAFDDCIAGWRNECFIPNWKDKCTWNDKFEKTNRTHFDMSLGTLLTVYLPYEECQKLDDAEINSKLVDRIRMIIEEIKTEIDCI
jgi:hypothetical protein